MRALYFENRLGKVVLLKVLERFHRHAALGPWSPLRYADVPEPSLPNPRWLKVRILQCGLCGTDLHFMFMDIHPRNFAAALPGIERKFLGHELVGEVVACGDEVTDFIPGNRVVMRIDWPSCAQLEISPPCGPCARGSYMLCENLGLRPWPAAHQGGGFSPCMVMHQSQPFLVPDWLDNDAAVLLEPLASCVHGVLRAPPEAGQHALVVGAGAIGLLTAAVLRSMFPEVDVACLARYEFQARTAERLGAVCIRDGSDRYAELARRSGARHIRGPLGNSILLGGFDRIYDTVGTSETVGHALRWAKAGGKVVLMGIDMNPGSLDFSPVWCQEVELLGINCHATEADGRNSFEIAADLMRQGAVDPGDFITHRFGLHDWRKAVKTFLNKGQSQAIKIVLKPSH